MPEKDGTQEKLPAERQRKEGGEAGRHPAERKVTIQETQNENGFVISKGDGFRIKADKEVKTEAVLDQKTQEIMCFSHFEWRIIGPQRMSL